ncbi:hypothetical protein CONCODRAFT_3771 [Conidiobolus coronatus NRRL 28638]|uniref:Zn(2)-C6 fungal-type domain-containing protein n=1 Tax=Conidiobolus coronatus (strain ATCC 28846 / CBS 209.66 / NRRL 28638) TaxID=796925 RepID=A0A137PE98_CONC2|nr:hypothetical protein CONCODRAFT_3771 [Conidiobolus coronatus NRRL 28638]|eukprot:KXN73292.1 hypothetical protein CONCODRAFT_3771 [Conidiobolus coronatus NRRL 28638]
MNSNLVDFSCQQVKPSQQKSCDGCKAHHIKCDRNVDGCKNCFKRGIACTYLVKSKRRGPKTKVEHFMRYYESLNKTNESEAPGTFINKEYIKNNSIEMIFYNTSQYTSNTEEDFPSISNSNQFLAADDSILYQTGSDMFPLYQNIYNPMLDISCYNLPLPHELTTVTIMGYELSPVYSSLTQPNFQSSPILNQNACSMYFN